MINASELLEEYAEEKIYHNTRIIYHTKALSKALSKTFSLKIILSDITDIELQLSHESNPTITFKDILNLFMEDKIVGSTEISLVNDHKNEDKRELEFVFIGETVIIITTV